MVQVNKKTKKMKYSAKKKQEKTKTKQGKNDKLNKQGKKKHMPPPTPNPNNLYNKTRWKSDRKKKVKRHAQETFKTFKFLRLSLLKYASGEGDSLNEKKN